MKIKNVISGILFLSLILSAGSCYAAKVSCTYTDPNGGSIDGEIFDYSQPRTEAHCAMYKSPFYAEEYPNAYADCLKTNQLLEKAYKEGKCQPILTQKHASADTTCTVEYYYKDASTKKAVSFLCDGAKNREFIDKVKQMYK